MIHKALHLKDDIDRLYILRKEGGGYASIEYSVDESTGRLADYKISAKNTNYCDKK